MICSYFCNIMQTAQRISNQNTNKKQKENKKKEKRMSIRNLQYISDIHLERKIGYPKLVRKENNIALLGDIGNPFHQNYRDFLSYTSDRWENVFLLAGNHEYWQEKYNYYDVNDKIEEVCSLFDNITFLNNKRTSLSFCCSFEYLILGTTLWSHISSWNVMGDDLRINLVDKSFNTLHEESKNWLVSELSILKEKEKQKGKHKKNREIIVLSHHLPSYSLIIEKYRQGFYSKYHDRFASHLDSLIKPPINYWLCGHSHCVLNTSINGVYCGINSHS